ncbi:MAG: peroxidase [Planctomycetota bacterium]|nr:peroxidase [Planctomycetota bacterium]
MERIQKLIVLIGENFEDAEIGEAEKSMLRYVQKLTVQPSTVNLSDINLLRQAGFDDLAIHDLCAVISYFGFVNRIANGLGVELESQDRGQVSG